MAASLTVPACYLPEAGGLLEPPAHYAGVSYFVQAKSKPGATRDEVDALTDDAPLRLAKGKKLAFFPPDRCLDTEATPMGADNTELAGMTCGPLLSSLETTAAKSGYEVVSWQLLKGRTPLKAAKEFNVDVLLEVDSFTFNERGAGKRASTGLEFFEQTRADDRRPLPVEQSSGLRCKAYIDNAINQPGNMGSVSGEEDGATLAVKAVDVETGRAIWYYQRTIKLIDGQSQAQSGSDLYFELVATAPPRPKPKYNGMQVGGGAALGMGLPLTAIGGGLSGPSSTRGTASFALLGTGIALAVVGGTLIAFGNQKQKQNERDRGRVASVTYGSPDAALCSTRDVSPPWQPGPMGTATAPSGKSTSFNFEQQQAGDTDVERQKREQLAGKAAQDLVHELLELSAGSEGTR